MRYYSNTAQEATLSATVGAATATLAVSGTAGFPTSTPYTLVVDADMAGEEIVTVTGASGTNLTVTRGEEDTSATAHDAGATVRHYHTARDFAEPQAHANATANAHGATGAVVGTTNTQTLTNKTLGSTNSVNGFTASRLMQSDSSGQLAASSKTIPVGAVVGTSDTQVLTNKDLSGAGNVFPASLGSGSSAALNTAVFGGSARTKRPFAKLTLQANQSIPDSNATEVNFSAVDEQTDSGMGSVADNSIVPPIAGLYQISAYVNFAVSGVGRRLVRLKVNGTNVRNMNVLPPNAGGTAVQLVPPPIRLSAGATVTLDVYQTSGGALNLTENADGGIQELSALWVAP